MRRILEWLGRHAVLLVVLIVAVLGVTLLAVWRPRSGTEHVATAEIWTCSMHPQVRLPKPGRCPICGMNLIPVENLVQQKGQLDQQTGLESEELKLRRLVKEIRAVGKLDYNESRVEVITARVAGRADRLYVDFTGVDVKQGDHLVELYSPDLIVNQRELLLAAEAAERVQGTTRSGDDRFVQANLKAAREKLLLLGILPEQIEQIEKTKKPQTHITIFAPLAGTVIEKQVRVGQYVQEGDMLYRIAELDPIWLYLNIYEYDIGWIEYGQDVAVTLEAYPGETFRGVVTFVDPFLDDKTRAVKVRVNLKNPRLRLKPAMYASAVIRVPLRSDGTPQPTGYAGKYSCPMHPEVVRDEAGLCPICQMKLVLVPSRQSAATAAEESRSSQEPRSPGDTVLAIPVTAVLDTGVRHVAYRLRADGAYELVELQIGSRATDVDDARQRSFFPVFSGLRAGDRVVTSGGFMLDSQRQIEGMPSLLYPQGQSAASLHAGHGGTSNLAAPGSPSGHKH
jgi:membrane fusion protein, copper/silver efflux system